MRKRRKYELRARAESQRETRQRITTAAMELHEKLGPVHTSISAIAARAGVQRLTVYRHFPDELSLLKACGGHYRALHPPPDPTTWKIIKEGRRRLFVGLVELYGHFRETASVWNHVLRDAELSKVVREAAAPRFRYLEEAGAVLAEGWHGRMAGAAIRHAVQFHTWKSLTHGGQLLDREAADLMTRLVLGTLQPADASEKSS